MRAQARFKRRAHPISLILVHVGVGQRCRAPDKESPAALPTMSTHMTFQRGAGLELKEGSTSEHTLAWFLYTLVSISAAVPLMSSPPPNCQT